MLSSYCLDIDSTVYIFPPSVDPMTVVLFLLSLCLFPSLGINSTLEGLSPQWFPSEPGSFGLIYVIEMPPLLSFVNSKTSKFFLFTHSSL
jgi:hypothetical protein